ncbi:S-layer homology domain-containing protein [Sinanaerobacter chloroacetimidivorans]|uniref:S-layer homology domain-containing protein n=1 Tax=Sinanaerobacter chloroacetimidivorans TaxID=2818044 RepID=A0A8J7W4S4_9FIRM|nr:S-layer homology domain-containing protein [Sinanaerobacter chloroacetimidivorans]MBR0599190.1 S-layer homology domain-containing protein [Sinanaerobacter chloroacetimidivorans]
MKKILVLLLIIIFGLAVTFPTFADFEENQRLPADTAGSLYEEAVKTLIGKGVVSCYEDGTFRPEKTLNRAEACLLIVKCINPSESAIRAEKNDYFNDLNGYGWAEEYIDHALEKGIVKGYGNGSFRPGSPVTYYELSAMLVNALGYQESELQGSWPRNYLDKAFELGAFQGIAEDLSGFDSGQAVTRGNAALMAEAAVRSLEGTEAAKEHDSKSSSGAEAPSDSESPSNLPKESQSAGKLSDFSGRAFGMILGISKVLNTDGDQVQQIEFLMGKDTFHLNTDGKNTISNPISFDGSIYCLKMSNGIVNDADTDGRKLKAKRYAELTGGWKEVEGRENKIITVAGSGDKITVMKDAIFYIAVFDGNNIEEYKSGVLADITGGSLIRAYDITDDSADNADIVVIVKSKDKSKLM